MRQTIFFRRVGRPRAALLIAFLLGPGGATAQGAMPAAATSTAIERQDIRAELVPRRYTTISAEIGAKINRIDVPEGGRFKAGQTLVSLDCALQQAQSRKARASLAAAEHTYAANKRLAQLNSVGKVELEVSEAEAGKARAEVSLADIVLDKCRIVAPFDGRVAEQRVRPQQYVQPGQPMLEILDDSALELDFIVPSKWLVWLKPDQRFQVAIDETGKTYPAKVQRIGARVDPVSQSIKLTAVIDGTFGELMAGMSGKVLMAPPNGS
ncbi:efflux RND transporter periplasmic adaptor subunit [Bordetella genomosp. 11]|uniref:Efflux transporter periplasmic adaptor subunit n=1 Tax=Bordetella genomosp. 11 TaxID=1416808 RepID=A0A261UJZ1_9BORD|nr:efflux RND transporter periplasmic adaptor subunit [Bordetella genomosp. 11]OZI61961.1 efflux transporter periplasmic adaptor subunit [Bordetella genomosp. 11]